MSPSDVTWPELSISDIAMLLDRASATANDESSIPAPTQVTVETLNVLIAAVARLYALREGDSDGPSILDDRTATTEAVILACALIRAHGLNPFDLALWFSRG